MPKFKTTRAKQLTFDGVTGSLPELHAIFQFPVTVGAMRHRMRKGMSLAEAAGMPPNEQQRQRGNAHLLAAQAHDKPTKAHEKPAHKRRATHPPEILEKYCEREGDVWVIKRRDK